MFYFFRIGFSSTDPDMSPDKEKVIVEEKGTDFFNEAIDGLSAMATKLKDSGLPVPEKLSTFIEAMANGTSSEASDMGSEEASSSETAERSE